MYEMMMTSLRMAYGTGALRTVMIVVSIFAVIGLALSASRTFRSWISSLDQKGRAPGALAGVLPPVFKIALIFLLARILISAMVCQSRVFEQQHGRVTETNRSAVFMKWGSPHEQNELSVSHARKRIWVTRQLKLDDEKSTILTETFWKDEAPPVQAVAGKMPAVISTREEERQVPVDQNSIVSADVDIVVRNNPRTLGNANYAGYDDEWRMKYTVANESEYATSARMLFTLPAPTGLFDSMYLKVEGRDMLNSAKSEGNAVVWNVPMAAGGRAVVEIGYKSRGLEHLRYIPRRMSQTGHYRVSMTVHGIPPDKLDYPIGSMPPAERLADISSTPYTLTWVLDNALTSYDIGVKLPMAEQPNYHFANLLREAPVGLVILLGLLIIPRLITRIPVSPAVIAAMAVGYFLLYTFMGRLADIMTGFSGPFVLAVAILVIAMACFRLLDPASRFAGTQDAMVFAVLAVGYPLAIVDSDRTAFWMQWIYVGSLIYICALIVLSSTKPKVVAIPPAPEDQQERNH